MLSLRSSLSFVLLGGVLSSVACDDAGDSLGTGGTAGTGGSGGRAGSSSGGTGATLGDGGTGASDGGGDSEAGSSNGEAGSDSGSSGSSGRAGSNNGGSATDAGAGGESGEAGAGQAGFTDQGGSGGTKGGNGGTSGGGSGGQGGGTAGSAGGGRGGTAGTAGTTGGTTGGNAGGSGGTAGSAGSAGSAGTTGGNAGGSGGTAGSAGSAGSGGSSGATSGSGGTAGGAGDGTGGTSGTSGGAGDGAGGTSGIGGGGIGGGGIGGGGIGGGGIGGGGIAGTGGTSGIGGGGIGGTSGTGGTSGAASTALHLYVGCNDALGSIQRYSVEDGTFTSLGEATEVGGGVSNSTFNLAKDRLYVAHFVAGTTGPAGISSFTRDVTTGELAEIGSRVDTPFDAPGGAGGGPNAGLNAGPQTLTLDADESFLAVPNYFANNVYVYEVNPDDTLGDIVDFDAGGVKAHHAVFSNDGAYLLVPYLDSNKIRVYDYNASDISLLADTSLPAAGSGPRHIALHSNGEWLYSINETSTGATTGTIDFFLFDDGDGTLTPEDRFSVPLPVGYSGGDPKNGSEIEIAPSGKFLYVSMRLDGISQGSIVVYAIDPTTGALSLVEQESSRGLTPRHFSLSPDGTLLIAGNQNSANVALFDVDTTTGELDFVGLQSVCLSPRFARFAEIQ